MLEYDPNETFYAGDGNDVVDAGNGNDIIYGGAGNDRIYGGNGDDILYGGTGDDRLEGGMGNDTYYFDLGDGKDVINDYESSSTEGRDDKIIFGEGICPEDVQMERIGNDLLIRYSDNDSITVQDAYYYSDGRYQIEKMQFQDESVYNIDYTNTKLEPEILNNEIAEESAAQVMCEDISQEYVCVENSPEEGILVDDNMDMLASEMANLAIQEMSETTTGNVADTFNMASNSGNETDVQLWIEK